MLRTKPTMSIAELQESRVWSRLAPQQQAFLTDYLSAGRAQGGYNEAAACKLAYPKIKNTKVWLARLKANPRIRAVLHTYFGDPDTKDPLDELKALLKRSRRKNAKLDILVPYWIRTVALLEEIAAKGNTIDVKHDRT
jgi:hypothetical protein